MSYHLGIDLGTTYTAAAVHEAGRVEVIPLGDRGPSIPSVLYLKPDGNIVAGDAANRHATTDPERIAREFKRRLGDPTPVQLGGVPTPPEQLTSHLLRSVYDTVVRAKGAAPATVVLTHPANWGPYKRDLLSRAAESAGLARITLITEPQAAAISYASQERVEAGAVIGVYDLGGGTFDAAVLRKEPDGTFSILGTPEGIERLGGIDFDAAVFNHVAQSLEGVFDDLDPEDEAAVAAVARLRQECTQAKEALSLDTEAIIPVLLPNTQTEVRATRSELESMIRAPIAETVTALERALRSAGLSAADVSHVLLVGGSSRIPMVAGMVSAQLGRPVAVDAHPKHAIALGAAIVAAREAGVMVGDAAMTANASASANTANGAPAGAAVGAAAGFGAAAGMAGGPPPPGAAPPQTFRPPPPDVATPAAAAFSSPPAPPQPQSPPPAPPGQPPAPQSPYGGAPSPYPAAPPPGYGQAPPGGAYAGGQQQQRQQPPPPGPGSGWDPTFDAAHQEAPAPSLGYRTAGMPPPPGSSHDLPPGYLSREEKGVQRRKERNKGRIAVIVGTLLLLVCIAATIAITAKGSEKQTLADIEIGECFIGEELNDVEAVDCSEAHHGEVVDIIQPVDPNVAYPGRDALFQQASAACALKAEEYFGAGQDAISGAGLDIYPEPPSEGQWNDDFKGTYCYLGHADVATTFAGSVKGKGAEAAATTTVPPPVPTP